MFLCKYHRTYNNASLYPHVDLLIQPHLDFGTLGMKGKTESGSLNRDFNLLGIKRESGNYLHSAGI